MKNRRWWKNQGIETLRGLGLVEEDQGWGGVRGGRAPVELLSLSLEEWIDSNKL